MQADQAYRKSFDTYFEDRKYRVTLDDQGNAIAYAVWVTARGKNDTWRTLWHKGNGKPMPAKLDKQILNKQGTSELIALAMGW